MSTEPLATPAAASGAQTGQQIAQHEHDAEWGWVPVALAFTMVGLAACVFAAVGFKYLREDGIIVGAVLQWVGLGLGFWLGTSRSSERNGATVRQLATSPAPVPTLSTTVTDGAVVTDAKAAS